ncbi:MAG: serine hydrolase [Myxococcota bacterium]
MLRRLTLLVAAAILSVPASVPADEARDESVISLGTVDPILSKMEELKQADPRDNRAPLWDHRDPALQKRVDLALDLLDLENAVRRKRLGLVLVDITRIKKPKVAEVNGDVMMYAASLPKIAILLAAFEEISQGRMDLDPETEKTLTQMIQESSNTAATQMMRRVGMENIANVLLSPRYRLYDPTHNGGLWVGKDYAAHGLWRRDPLHNLSHGATAMQVARFYYLLEREELVSREHSRKMKEILAGSELNHKFMKPLRLLHPEFLMYRKSGSWRTYHCDSVLVKGNKRAYIAVALSDDPDGKKWLGKIIQAFDAMIFLGK